MKKLNGNWHKILANIALSNLPQNYESHFLPLESSFGLANLIDAHKYREESLKSFFISGNIQSREIFSEKFSVPPFACLITFLDLLEDMGQKSLLDLFYESDAFYFPFLNRRIVSGLSTCCNAVFAATTSQVQNPNRRYFLLGDGIVKPTQEILKSLKQGRFFFPDRGIFSLHESHISLILDDLETNEVVYPILDIVSQIVENSKESALVVEHESKYLCPISKKNAVFCSCCGLVYDSSLFKEVVKFSALASNAREAELLGILGLTDLEIETLDAVIEEENKLFLRLFFKIINGKSETVLVGVFRGFHSSYRRRLGQLVSFLRKDGRHIYVADSSLVVSKKYIGQLGSVARDTTLKLKRKSKSTKIKFLDANTNVQQRKVTTDDLVLTPELVRDRQKRLRSDTTFGSYIGIQAILRKLYLMHPISKSLGLSNSDLVATSSRYLCQFCSGAGLSCGACSHTGLSEYLDEIELQGIGYRTVLTLELGEVYRKFSFVKDVIKLSAPFMALGLDYIPLNSLVKSRKMEEFFLMSLAREGLTTFNKSGRIIIKELLYDFGVDQLALIQKWLEASGGEVILQDRSEIAMLVFKGHQECHSINNAL